LFKLALEAYRSNPTFDVEVKRFEYRVRPYLANIPQGDLDKRYHAICRNVLTLVGPERNNHPIESFLSSWYWVRKLVHIETEYERRELKLPNFVPPFDLELLSLKTRFIPRYPNACDFVVRYGEMSWLPQMLTEGTVILKCATAYEDESMNEARRDDELRHHTFSSASNVRITGPQGQPIRAIGDIRTTVELTSKYYLLCTSAECDPTLFQAFNADACLIIHDPDEFARRLEKAFAPVMGDSELLHFPVQYVDPYNPGPNAPDAPGAVKSFTYAYQKEYRFIWTPSRNSPTSTELKAKLGDLRDIAELLTFDDVLKGAA